MSNPGTRTQTVERLFTKNLCVEKDNKGVLHIYEADDNQTIYSRERIQLVKALDYRVREEDIIICFTTEGEIIKIISYDKDTERRFISSPIAKIEACSEVDSRNVCFYKYKKYYTLVFLQKKVLKFYFWNSSNINGTIYQTETSFKDTSDPSILCLDEENDNLRIIVGFKNGTLILYSPLSPFNMIATYNNDDMTQECLKLRKIVSEKRSQEEQEEEEEEYSSDSEKSFKKSKYSVDESDNDDNHNEEEEENSSLEELTDKPITRGSLEDLEPDESDKVEEETTDSSVSNNEEETSEVEDTREDTGNDEEEIDNVSTNVRRYYAIILVTICIIQVAYALYKWVNGQ